MSYDEKRYRIEAITGKKSNELLWLIAICLILFVGLAFLKALWYFNHPEDKQLAKSLFDENVFRLFTLPAHPAELLGKPWTILTSLFVHDNNDVWSVFSNMFWLWAFGFILQDLTGGKKIIPVFIYGGLGGALAFVLAHNFISPLKSEITMATLAAAPCGVMAVAIVATLVSPAYRIFPMIAGGIPLWAITGLYCMISFASVSMSDSAVLISRLAAAFTGYLFIFCLHRGYDWSGWMNNFFDWVNNLFNPDKPKKGKSVKDELFYKTSSSPYKKTPKLTQEKIDAILDKINQQGFDALTKEEKEVLKRASQEDI